MYLKIVRIPKGGFAHCKPSRAGQRKQIRIGNKHTQSLCLWHTKCRTGSSATTPNRTKWVDWKVFVFTTDSVADFWHQKYAKSNFSQLPAIFSVMGSQTKNWSWIFSQDNFMENKFYSIIFFSKLIFFIDNSENVIEKHDKSVFSIHFGSLTSNRTQNF